MCTSAYDRKRRLVLKEGFGDDASAAVLQRSVKIPPIPPSTLKKTSIKNKGGKSEKVGTGQRRADQSRADRTLWNVSLQTISIMLPHALTPSSTRLQAFECRWLAGASHHAASLPVRATLFLSVRYPTKASPTNYCKRK